MCYRRRDDSGRSEILLAIGLWSREMLILVAVLTVVSVVLIGALLRLGSQVEPVRLDAYTAGRQDQIELESIVDLIDRDDPALFSFEVEQLVAEQLVERFGEIISATIVELDGSERPIGEWDLSDRLEFYRQIRDGIHDPEPPLDEPHSRGILG